MRVKKVKKKDIATSEKPLDPKRFRVLSENARGVERQRIVSNLMTIEEAQEYVDRLNKTEPYRNHLISDASDEWIRENFTEV